jgi:hypothetical protein
VHRTDRRNGRRGGGVLLAIRNGVALSTQTLYPTRSNLSEYDFDFNLCKVNFNFCSLYLAAVYFPPGSSATTYSDFFHIIENLVLPNKKLIILGDFNLYSAGIIESDYTSFSNLFNLKQFSSVKNSLGRTLDLVLSNVGCTVVSECDEPLVPEDVYHPSTCTIVSFKHVSHRNDSSIPPLNRHNPQWNFSNGNFLALYNSLSTTDWTSLYEQINVNTALDIFYNKFYNSLDSCFPRRLIHLPKYSYPKWFTPEIIYNLRSKAYYHALWKKHRRTADYSKFSCLRNSLKCDISSAHKSYLTSIGRNIVSDPNCFWKYIHSLSSSSTTKDNAMMTLNNDPIENHGISDAFAKHFESLYSSIEPLLDPDSAGPSSATQDIQISAFDEKDMEYGFSNLSPKSSFGPDGLPPYVVKGCYEHISFPLKHIFNLIIASSTFPDAWKITRLRPLHKKGSRSEISNYRPIAVLSAPCKLFESILHIHINRQIDSRLSDSQHGFRLRRSTVTNLIVYNNFISNSMDKSIQVDSVYTDISKAFDRVDHDILLQKLCTFGASYSIICFFASYLKNRRQFVDYHGNESRIFRTNSGVPQGSNLGPILFLIFFDDIVKVITNSSCLLFADDLKLFRTIETPLCCAMMQSDLDAISQWSILNKLEFATSKCNIISFSRSRHTLLFPYTLSGIILNRVTEIKDLGVLYDAKFTFNQHILDISTRSSKMLGFVMRVSKSFENVRVLRTLYVSFVLSILEYASIIWSPNRSIHTIKLDRVHNRFLRFLYLRTYGFFPYDNDNKMNFPTRFLLGMLSLQSLSTRRVIVLLKHFFLLLRGFIYNPYILANINFHVPTNITRSSTVFKIPRRRTDVMFHDAVYRAISLFDGTIKVDLFFINYIMFVDVLNRLNL